MKTISLLVAQGSDELYKRATIKTNSKNVELKGYRLILDDTEILFNDHVRLVSVKE